MRTTAPTPSDLSSRAAAVKNNPDSAKGGEWPQAKVSPDLWGTMLDLIYSGHANEAWKFLDDAWPTKVHGKENFEREFRAQLAKSPYWSAVEAMNAAKPPAASPSPTAAK